MTLHETQRELEAFDRDSESVAELIADIDTARLHLLADAIRDELTERYEGKPWDKARLH